jgi:hypothetical protein
LPPMVDKNYFDSVSAVSYFELAKKTGGEMNILLESKHISKQINKIVEDNASDGSDIVLLIDKTTSMEDDILQVKDGLKDILKQLEYFENIRVAVAFYGDKHTDGKEWFEFKNFESDFKLIDEFIGNVKLTWGGDWDESIYDAYFELNKQDFWRSNTKRMVLLIGDAPSHEKPLSEHSMGEVIVESRKSKVKMNFYPILVANSNVSNSTKASITNFVEANLISSIYPNPSIGPITLKLNEASNYTVQIFDINGNLLIDEVASGSEWKNDLSDKPNGVYICRTIDERKRYEMKKFVIEK